MTSSLTPRSASARSFWSASRRTSWIERSSSLTMSSNTNSSRRTSSASSSSVSASESSTLRSVERSAWLRMSASDLTPPATSTPAGRRSRASRASRPRPADHVRAGLAHPRDPQRDVGLLASGRCASTCAASVVCRLATTSAIVCGASLRRNVTICSAGVRRRNSNGRISITVDSRPMISAARVATERALEHVARVLDAAGGERVIGLDRRDELLEHASRSSPAATRWSFAISSDSVSISSSRRCLKIVGRAIAAERDEQHGRLLAALQSRSCARRRCLDRERSDLRVSSSSAIAGPLVLGHPRADLLGDAVRIALDEVLDLALGDVDRACCSCITAGCCARRPRARPATAATRARAARSAARSRTSRSRAA